MGWAQRDAGKFPQRKLPCQFKLAFHLERFEKQSVSNYLRGALAVCTVDRNHAPLTFVDREWVDQNHAPPILDGGESVDWTHIPCIIEGTNPVCVSEEVRTPVVLEQNSVSQKRKFMLSVEADLGFECGRVVCSLNAEL